MLRTRWMAAPACALLLLVGCTDDASDGGSTTTTTAADDGGTTTTRPAIDPESIEGGEQAYVDAFIATYQGTEGANPLFTESQAECLAPAWVDAIGIDRFAAAGVAPDDIEAFEVGLDAVDIPADVADEMVAAITDCGIDVRATVLSTFVPTGDLPPELGDCLDAAITTEVAEEVFRQQILGSEEAPEAFAQAQACFDDYEASVTQD